MKKGGESRRYSFFAYDQDEEVNLFLNGTLNNPPGDKDQTAGMRQRLLIWCSLLSL